MMIYQIKEVVEEEENDWSIEGIYDLLVVHIRCNRV
jgi:hypothetical protein